MALKRAMPRVTPVRHFLLMLLFCGTAQAELVRIRVKVLNASEVDSEYLESVIGAVRSRFRADLRIRIRFAVRESSIVDHDQFISLEDRYEEFIEYSKILKRPRWNRVTFVATPPYYSPEGCSYGAGLSTWFALGVIRQVESCSGAAREQSDIVTVSHELCHAIAYNRRRYGHESRCDHTPEERTDSIMHADALRYADNGLRFLKQTKKEINL